MALTGVVAAAGLAVTVGVLVLPFARFAYRAPVLHVVLETGEGCIALLVAYLLFGRFLRTGRMSALLVTCGLVVVAVANLALQALPQALGQDELTAWAPLGTRLLGVGLLSAAALTPPTRRIDQRRARAGVVLSSALGLGLVLAAVVLGDRLPLAVDPEFVPLDALVPALGSHPVALTVQVVSGLLFAVAAVAFTRRAQREGDELLKWLGAGCALAAVARVSYVLYPSLYSDYVYVGDLLRLGFYLLMLVGALREVRSYWESLSLAAVLEDRRRLARDLHDGLAQELTYILSQSRLLARDPGDAATAERIGGAAARAVDEARTAIAALTRTSSDSFAAVLCESVEGLGGRYGTAARIDVDDALEVTPEQADAVLRIVAEAFRNAVRHGEASCVVVAVTGLPLVVRVCDDGKGFVPGASKTPSGAGFGLTSMRERAEGVGARFDLRSEVGAGTTVEVRWP